MSLERVVVRESKKVLEKMWAYPKNRVQPEGALNGQSWEIWGKKITTVLNLTHRIK